MTIATTLTGLLMELTQGRKKLVETQPSLGVRAGCQLFERFVGASGAGEVGILGLMPLSPWTGVTDRQYSIGLSLT
jgi:hypothetical protein